MKGNRARAVVVTALVAWGCSVPSEQAILDQFFVHSRLRDKTALAAVSTVIFEPLEQGVVTDFTVVDRAVLSRTSGGDVTAKDVTLTAPVKLPSGEVKEETLVVRMERQPTGWKITAIRQK